MNKKIDVIIFDLDGVIFNSTELNKYAPKDKTSRSGWNLYNQHLDLALPNHIMINICKILSQTYPIIFLTAREYAPIGDSSNTYKETINCLNKAFNGFAPVAEPHKLIMRKYDDYNDSDVVKEGLLKKYIINDYNPLLAIDDEIKNCEMFKRYGIDTIHYSINNNKEENIFLNLTKRMNINA